MTGVFSGGVAFLVAAALVPLLVRFAVGRDMLDMPNLRSSHEVPTPRLGGVAIILGTWCGVILLAAGPGGLPQAWPLLAAATLVGLVGLLDDLGELPSGLRAGAQVLLAAGLVYLFPPPLVAEAPGVLALAAAAVGVLWIAALSNAFNFMDGIDGIAGGTVLVNALFVGALAGGALAGGVLPALAGAVAGFLLWNVNPAAIFLGDAGSYFAGFALAAVALYLPLPGGGWSPLGFLAGVLVFTPFLLDTAYTLLRRLRAGKDIFSAHREHIYQRITPDTTLHRRTSILYCGAGVVAGFAALLVAAGGAYVLAGLVVALALCGGLLALPRALGGGR